MSADREVPRRGLQYAEQIRWIDLRWRRIRRPVVITGGELTLEMLDLRYNKVSNFYNAPLHIKANGGVFLIDDFGRQIVSPRDLLNRWILPLEERIDFLTLATGKKFSIPFEQLIIFSTNLDPRELVDQAFLRRIRHKIAISAPTARCLRRSSSSAVSSGEFPLMNGLSSISTPTTTITADCPDRATREIYWISCCPSADLTDSAWSHGGAARRRDEPILLRGRGDDDHGICHVVTEIGAANSPPPLALWYAGKGNSMLAGDRSRRCCFVVPLLALLLCGCTSIGDKLTALSQQRKIAKVQAAGLPRNERNHQFAKKVKNPAKLKLSYAYWMERAGKLPDARVHYSEILKEDGECVEALLGLARIEHKTGQAQQAEELIRKALTLEPDSAEAHHTLSQFYAGQRRCGQKPSRN